MFSRFHIRDNLSTAHAFERDTCIYKLNHALLGSFERRIRDIIQKRAPNALFVALFIFERIVLFKVEFEFDCIFWGLNNFRPIIYQPKNYSAENLSD